MQDFLAFIKDQAEDYVANGRSLTIGARRILSDRVGLTVRTSSETTNRRIRIGEFDEFTATKKDEVKVFKPAGSLKEYHRVIDGGWELTFTTAKVDYSLSRLITDQELLLSEINKNLGNNALVSSRSKNISPKYDVIQEILYYDGSREVIIYEDCSFVNYTQNVRSDLAEVQETFRAHCPNRYLDKSSILIDTFTVPDNQYIVANIVEKIQKSAQHTY